MRLASISISKIITNVSDHLLQYLCCVNTLELVLLMKPLAECGPFAFVIN